MKRLVAFAKRQVGLVFALFAVRLLKATGFFDSYFGPWRGALFDHAQKLGIHLLPVHYYSPVPLAKAAPDEPGPFPVDTAASVSAVQQLLRKYEAELAEIFAKPAKGEHDYDPANSSFSPVDAGVFYGMVRQHKPKRIIEIASGMSTLIAAAAIRAEPAYEPEFTCIEPYMPPYLSPPPSGVTEVVQQPLQQVARDRFDALEAGDFLFIDSTHVVNYGSDVAYEFLEILPNLRPGVHIHVHDIFLPYDYPALWIERHRFFWNEQYLLQAALTYSPQFKITAAVHAAHRAASFPNHSSEVIPASFWFVKEDQ